MASSPLSFIHGASALVFLSRLLMGYMHKHPPHVR
jgi:hypothetical protein